MLPNYSMLPATSKGTCIGCGQPLHKGRKFCSHECYSRHIGPRQSLGERFWLRVDKNGPLPPHRPELGPCWIWTGYKDDTGRGQMSKGRRGETRERAHRVSWMIHHGPIPPGRVIGHSCDNPTCVRPDHLFLGTQAENIADMTAKGRRQNSPRLGTAHHKAKLTDAQVAAIRRERLAGATLPQLASKYGVAKTTVWGIVSGRAWRHIE